MSAEHLSKGSKDPPLVNGKIRLYSMRFCPYAERVHLILNAKNVPYDVVYIDLLAKPEWYTDRIPTGKVPALIIDGTDLYESLVIADFLDEKYGESKLHPADPLKKAKDRILVESFNKVTSGIYRIYFASAEEKPALYDEVLKETEFFEKELNQRGTYFSGDKPGMADYMIWPWFERIPAIPLVFDSLNLKFSEDRFPKLNTWMKSMQKDKAVAQHYLTPKQHAHFLKLRLAGTADYNITNA